LTGVGVVEEQARKVVAGEASRCGEHKAWFEGLLTILTTKIQPSKPRVREAYTTSFMHIFCTNKVP
jgi:hypothetical protein